MTLELIPMEPHTVFLAINYNVPPTFTLCFLLDRQLYMRFHIKTIYIKFSNQSSCGRQSKAFDRSVNKAPKVPPPSTLTRHFLSLQLDRATNYNRCENHIDIESI